MESNKQLKSIDNRATWIVWLWVLILHLIDYIALVERTDLHAMLTPQSLF